MLFVGQLMFYLGDLCGIQMIYSTLDSISVSVSRMVATHGGLDEEIVSYVKKSSGANVVPVDESAVPEVGEIYAFRIYKEYKPLIISNSTMEVTLTRYAMIGYIN